MIDNRRLEIGTDKRIDNRRLEIGTDKRIDNTWEIMNLSGDADIIADLRKPLVMIDDDTYDLIYISHVLEHIPWFQTVDVLKELYRILRNDGIIEIWVPDFKKIVDGYLDNNLISLDGWYKYNPKKDPYLWINGRIFTYGPGDDNWHRAVFDKVHLSNCLKEAGFVDIDILSKPRGYSHGWIGIGMGGKAKKGDHVLRPDLARRDTAIAVREGGNNNIIISMSFDDATKSDLIAFREMDKYCWKGTSCIITGILKNDNRLSLGDVKYLYKNGWEIASHTATHPHLPKLSDIDLDDQLKSSKDFLKYNGVDVTTLSYPYGDYDQRVINMTKKYYSLGRIVSSNGYYIGDKEFSKDFSAFTIKAMQVNDNVNVGELTKNILNLRQQNKFVWLNIFFHSIAERPSKHDYEISLKKFRKILEVIYLHNIDVYTIRDGYEAYMKMVNGDINK